MLEQTDRMPPTPGLAADRPAHQHPDNMEICNGSGIFTLINLFCRDGKRRRHVS
jgi:hypothetical protein